LSEEASNKRKLQASRVTAIREVEAAERRRELERLRVEEAAAVVQGVMRGGRSRKDVRGEREMEECRVRAEAEVRREWMREEAAKSIQSVMRGRGARQAIMSDLAILSEQEISVVRIQGCIRGRGGRKEAEEAMIDFNKGYPPSYSKQEYFAAMAAEAKPPNVPGAPLDGLLTGLPVSEANPPPPEGAFPKASRTRQNAAARRGQNGNTGKNLTQSRHTLEASRSRSRSRSGTPPRELSQVFARLEGVEGGESGVLLPLSEDEITMAFKQMDMNSDGVVSKEEFIQAYTHVKLGAEAASAYNPSPPRKAWGGVAPMPIPAGAQDQNMPVGKGKRLTEREEAQKERTAEKMSRAIYMTTGGRPLDSRHALQASLRGSQFEDFGEWLSSPPRYAEYSLGGGELDRQTIHVAVLDYLDAFLQRPLTFDGNKNARALSGTRPQWRS